MRIYKNGKPVGKGVRRMLTATASAKLQQALMMRPSSIDDLVDVSGLAKPVVARYVNELYQAHPKMVYVADWRKDSRGYPTIRLFVWGSLPDRAKPMKWENNAARMRASRAADSADHG